MSTDTVALLAAICWSPGSRRTIGCAGRSTSGSPAAACSTARSSAGTRAGLARAPPPLRADLLRARTAEDLIKQHRFQLAADRTSCQGPLANQFRLRYRPMLVLCHAVPRRMPLAWCEFVTLRQKLLKIGARVVEKAARVRIHFAPAFPDVALFPMLAGRITTSGP